jgi:hypothetical protein
MNTATKYSVSDAATLYKKSRATLYKDIKNGVLSRDHDGFIDFSELLRVYGEPFGVKQVKRIDTSPIQNQNTSEYTDKTVVELKNQIDFLKKQLEKAEDREAKANARIGVVSGNGKYSTLRFFNCAQWPKFSTTYLGFASP